MAARPFTHATSTTTAVPSPDIRASLVMGREQSPETLSLGRQVEAERCESERIGEGQRERKRERARQDLSGPGQCAGSKQEDGDPAPLVLHGVDVLRVPGANEH